MAPKPGRRRRGGVLTQLGKVPHSKKKKRPPQGPFRRALRWVGYGAAAVAGAALVFLFVSLMFNPNLGARPGEAEVRVEDVAEGGNGASARAAYLVVTLENRKVRIPVPEDGPAPAPGTRLHVQYTYFPRTGIVRVDRWEPAPDESPETPAR